jgi:peptidoglycan hydrolase FlgJ
MTDLMQMPSVGASAAEVRTPKAARDRNAAMQMAKDFESVFLADALKLMYQGVAVDPLGEDGNAGQSWRELLVDEYAKHFEARGGIGLAEPIARQLLQIQEAHSG